MERKFWNSSSVGDGYNFKTFKKADFISKKLNQRGKEALWRHAGTVVTQPVHLAANGLSDIS